MKFILQHKESGEYVTGWSFSKSTSKYCRHTSKKSEASVFEEKDKKRFGKGKFFEPSEYRMIEEK